ncbi:Asp/Glu/hydantoin racemase [Herbaspirillum rubrisubalbicans]|nr:Asp/Glu/hydantoin racemase [Herbaspirillum rubrisubalbicans]
MAELCAAIGRDIGAPVIDGVTAAVKLAESLVALGLGTAKRGEWAQPLPKAYHGLLSGFARS